jgi:branched-chain amino acid transport system substrate-binding protein
MSQRQDITVSLIALLITGVFIAGILFFLKNGSNIPVPNPNSNPNSNLNPTISSTTSSTENSTKSIKETISFGDKILIDKEESGDKNKVFQAAKQKGIEAMTAKNYTTAVVEFENAIKNYKNAPETLIYLNNARIGNNKAYTIALVAPIAANVDSALKMLRGIAQAQDEINKNGGINSIPLKVVIVDDEGKAEIAKQVASNLVKNPEILAVIGHHSSGSTLAAREVYESEKLVAISSTSTSIKLSEPYPNSSKRYVFRTVPNDSIAAKALANYMLTGLNKRKAAVFYDPKSAYSQSLKQEFVGEIIQNQGEIVDEFQFTDKEQNFEISRYLKQAINKGAEALMIAAPDDKINQTLRVINTNDNRLPLLGGDDIYDIKILQEGGSRAKGIVIAMAWHIDANPNSEFVRASKNLWGANVDWKTAMTYDASQALIAALKRNPNPTRNLVQEALSSPNFQASGVSHSIRLVNYSGDRNAPVQLVQVEKVPEGKKSHSDTGFDFVPVKTK